MSSFFKWLLGLAVAKLPWDSIIVFVLNYALKKFINSDGKQEDYDKVVKTVGHVAEALAVVESVLADGKITIEEGKSVSTFAKDLRVKLVEDWSDQKSSKVLETAVSAENPILSDKMEKIQQMQEAAEFKSSND